MANNDSASSRSGVRSFSAVKRREDLRSKYLEGGNGKSRQINGEDASVARKVARMDASVIGFGAPPAESETETHACPIRAALLERAKERVDVPTRHPAALIPDLDKHSLRARCDAQRNRRPRPGELEGVLQKIPHD
jgi:hypothetical protein